VVNPFEIAGRDLGRFVDQQRRLPTVAMLSPTAIGEYYLRPVDY